MAYGGYFASVVPEIKRLHAEGLPVREIRITVNMERCGSLWPDGVWLSDGMVRYILQKEGLAKKKSRRIEPRPPWMRYAAQHLA